MNAIADIKKIWPKLGNKVHLPKNEKEYKEMVGFVEELMDEIGEAENHPLISLLETLALFVSDYEEEHFPVAKSQPHEVLAFFMEQHGLKQKDLPEIGSQGVISEILSGKRKLNDKHIEKLCARFGVSKKTFGR